MTITPNQWDAIYALKEHYSLCMDNAVDGEEYERANAAFVAIVEILIILGE